MVKVIATYGPSLYEEQVLDVVLRETDILRLNISHQDPPEAKANIQRLKAKGAILMVDTSGPEIRIRCGERRTVRKGEILKVNGDIRFEPCIRNLVKKGDHIYVGDQGIPLRYVGKGRYEAERTFTLKDRLSVNMKGRPNNLPILKESDRRTLSQNEIDMVALSFTRRAKDVKAARRHTDADIIAKIENIEGVRNIEEILDEADGVMVARGDLGTELNPEEVPILQKEISRMAAEYAKPVIVATQVLYTMVNNPSPTRAEVSDIANAVLDGADAILLSNETAVGRYPVRAIRVIRRVWKRVREFVEPPINMSTEGKGIDPISDTLSKTVYEILCNPRIDGAVVITRSGTSARLLSRFKSPKEVIAITPDERTYRRMNLLYNVRPVLVESLPERGMITTIARMLHEKGLIKKSGNYVFTAAVRTQRKGINNLIEVHKINELLQR